MIRRTAFARSSSVKNQALVGESGNRKLRIHELTKESRDVEGAHKNVIAVMRVSVPVMIISLEKGEYIVEMLGLVVPLPRLKSCAVYVQTAKADKPRDNLSCNANECLRG